MDAVFWILGLGLTAFLSIGAIIALIIALQALSEKK